MNADWLHYDPNLELVLVTDAHGKTWRYAKGSEVPGSGRHEVEVTHSGRIIRFDEAALRRLPTRMILRRLPEILPVTGMPVRGATCVHFEFVRRD
jgi:hypothetical protein